MKKANHPVDAADTLEVVLSQLAQADGGVKVFLPALDTAINADRDKALLADGAAKAAGLRARGHVCEGIGQIVELAARKLLGRHVVLEPQDLGHLHLDVHGAANVAQQVVAGGIDGVSLLERTVVEP